MHTVTPIKDNHIKEELQIQTNYDISYNNIKNRIVQDSLNKARLRYQTASKLDF